MSGREESARSAEGIAARESVRAELTAVMQRVSRWVSAPALLLMLGGFLVTAFSAPVALPGPHALPLNALALIHPERWPAEAMSAGLLMLAFLPLLSVLVAATLYAVKRRPADMAVAVVVLLELLLSIRLKGG